MAKAATKTPAKTVTKAPKKPTAPKNTTPKQNPNQLIESVCIASLSKLQELDLDFQLQSEINWCLGSFRNDGNPVGLYLMAERALSIFKAELAAKRKGIAPALVKDIEKALNGR